jgi:SAM-dependent methyltransferase
MEFQHEGKGYIDARYKEDPEREKFGIKFARYIHDIFYEKPGKILDIGCGRCWYLEGFKQLGYDCYGTDYDMLAVKDGVKKGFKLKRAMVKDIKPKQLLPYEDETFDYIFCRSVIEHVLPRDIELFVEEMYRVLNKGGKLYVLTPHYKRTHKNFFDGLTHYTPFTKWRLKEFLKFKGFKNVKIGLFDNLPYIWRYTDLAFKIPVWIPFSSRPSNITAFAEKL